MKYTLVNSHREAADVVVQVIHGKTTRYRAERRIPAFSSIDFTIGQFDGERIVVTSRPAGVVTLHTEAELQAAKRVESTKELP